MFGELEEASQAKGDHNTKRITRDLWVHDRCHESPYPHSQAFARSSLAVQNNQKIICKLFRTARDKYAKAWERGQRLEAI